MIDDAIPADQIIKEEPVVDDEVPAEEENAESLNAVQGLVQRLSDQLDQLLQKQKEVGNMIKNVFDNDEMLIQATNLAKEAGKNLKDRTAFLNETAEVKDLKVKLTDIRDDLKMVQDSLDVNLLNYYQMTNSLSFPTADGDEREYVLKAKLKPKKKI